MLSDGNAFPSTDRSRLAEMLARDSGARKKAVSEVLVRYADPLRVYVAGSSLRANGDPADFVRGFLASRLAREAYLDDWIDSGLQLRRWLINGLHLFEKEEFRRSRPAGAAPLDDVPSGTGAKVEAAWAKSMILEAVENVRRELRESGHDIAWDIFRRHFIDDRSYRELEVEFGMRPAAMAEMSRRVSNLLREHLRLLLVRDGVKPEDVGAELRAMLQALQEHARD
jgi:hypothetical protein